MEQTLPEPKELTKQEKISLLTTFIDGGVLLAKTQNMKKCAEYFQDKDMAKRLGILWSDNAREIFPDKSLDDKDEDQIQQVIEDIWKYGQFFYKHGKIGDEQDQGNLVISKVLPWNSKTTIPTRIWHEVALMSMEEWIHILQRFKGTTLTDQNDYEVDVALFLQNRGVELTDTWIANNQARKEYFEKERKGN